MKKIMPSLYRSSARGAGWLRLGASSPRRAPGKMLFALAALALAAGCATEKEKPVLQRGWVGGEYKLVRAFPKDLQPRPKCALLVTALDTNTPVSIAGLRAGDLITQLDHQGLVTLRDFRRKIDQSERGQTRSMTVYRNGESREYPVTVGRETFHMGGSISVGLMVVSEFRLWPTQEHPDFSLMALGYRGNPGHRTELGSVSKKYSRKCNPKDATYDEDYDFWLAVVYLSRTREILAQEPVALQK